MKKTSHSQAHITIDPHTEQVRLNGQTFDFPYKTQAVFLRLIRSAPEPVSRQALIEEIWSGNYLTGEKSLTHALWVIRTELGESARYPNYIKTLPRVGYVWIGPKLKEPSSYRGSKFVPLAASLAAALLIGMGVTLSPAGDINTAQAATYPIVASNGTQAYRRGIDIIVDHKEGCRFVLQAGPETTFGTPVFSDNGEKLALRVEKAGTCKLTVIEFKTRLREDFDACPVEALKT